MTVASTTSRASYAGNGSTNTFTVPFYFLANTHLQIIKRAATGVEATLTLTTDYTVSGAGTPSGGSITCTVAPAIGETLVVLRNVPITQEVDYQSNDPFPAQTHEQALDKLTMEIQQVSEVISRAVTVPASDTTTPSQLINEIVAYNASSAASAASALSSLNTFKGTYYGAYASDPATDPLGNLPGAGDLYTNTSTGSMRVYTGSSWSDTAAATPVAYNTQLFNGTGAQTAFTLSSAPASLLATEVFISGVRQRSTTDYTVSGTTLTFTSAPASGTNNIFVRWTNSIAVGVPNNKSVTYPKIQDVQNKRLLGRNTAAAGDVEEVTLTQLLDWIGTTAQGDILFRGVSGWQRLAAGTAGQFLKTLGAGVDPAWAPLTGITSGTAVATTSGTAIDFTGIPSWAKRITVMLNGVSTNGASPIQVQIGTSGGVQVTGYASAAGWAGSAGAYAQSATGFITESTLSATSVNGLSGTMIISLLGANAWCEQSGFYAPSNGVQNNGGGSVTLSGTLDRIRLTTVNGTDAFDAGSVNILYEG